jgi:hypothetical protein
MRYRENQSRNSLSIAPKGGTILNKLKLSITETVSEKLFRSSQIVSSYKFEKKKFEERDVTVTGTEIMVEEDLELEKEMEEIKLDELRTKGVGRIVDRMIAEAIREGKFENIEGKGKKLEEDYFSAHLSSQDPLQRKLQSIMKDEGFIPGLI